MRRFILILVLVFAATPLLLRADERSKELVSGLTTKMAGYKSYQIDFTVSMPGQFENLPGRFVVSGERYRVSFNGLELFFDGKLVYTYNAAQKEVIIEEPNPKESNLLSNPVRFFRMSDRDFNHRYRGKAQQGARSVEWVELTPRTTGEGYSSIQLQLDPTTFLPVSVAYTVDQAAGTATILVKEFTPNVALSEAQFTFERSKHKDVEVIDFR